MGVLFSNWFNSRLKNIENPDMILNLSSGCVHRKIRALSYSSDLVLQQLNWHGVSYISSITRCRLTRTIHFKYNVRVSESMK